MDWGKLFLSAEGRIGRQTFWIGFLILLGANVVLGWIPLLGLLSVALIYLWICLYSKRFHDMGKSGWLAVIPVVVPGVLVTMAVIGGLGAVLGVGLFGDSDAAAGAAFAGLGLALTLGLLAFGLWLGSTLWAGLADSEPGPNRYGEPPSLPSAGVGAPSHSADL